MTGSSAHTTLTESDRAFLQHRVSRFGLVAGLIFSGFFAFLILTALYQGTGGEVWRNSVVGLFAAALCFLGIWAVTTRGERSPMVIYTIEAVGLLGAALCFNVMGANIPHAGRPDYILILVMFVALLGRAIYVPSSARRSLILGTLIAAETLVTIYWTYLTLDVPTWKPVLLELPQWQALEHELSAPRVARSMTANAAMWWTIIVFSTTATSHVVYGLRREAREAKKLGQYHLDGKIGEGGMGVVFKAHHALLRRPTAIKLLLPEKAGERSIERFEREVRLMAKLRHPNTVTVFDYGRSPDGIFYYAMEYIDGATLTEIIELTGPMETGRAIQVMTGAAAAMVEAHGIGLIHRDIKPSNLMLYLPHDHGIDESVKVLDFGLVKDISSGEGEVDVSKAGSITGTPQYMAPEAILDPESVDGRSDIYALGCVLFYLLTGEHTFDGKTVVEVCGKHLHEEPDRMSDRLGEEVDEQLEQLVADCLAKDPKKRPASVREMRDRLVAVSGFDAFTEHDASEWWDEYGAMFEHEMTEVDGKLTMDIARARTGSIAAAGSTAEI